MPASAAHIPQIAKASILTRSIRIPDMRAASALPPTACIWKPTSVRLRMIHKIT